MAQKPPSEFLLAVSGIQRRVPRRTLSQHPALRPQPTADKPTAWACAVLRVEPEPECPYGRLWAPEALGPVPLRHVAGIAPGIGRHLPAVRREGHRGDGVGVRRGPHFFAGSQVLDVQRAVEAAAREPLAVWRKRHAVNEPLSGRFLDLGGRHVHQLQHGLVGRQGVASSIPKSR
jgi:hypothetical protein